MMINIHPMVCLHFELLLSCTCSTAESEIKQGIANIAIHLPNEMIVPKNILFIKAVQTTMNEYNTVDIPEPINSSEI